MDPMTLGIIVVAGLGATVLVVLLARIASRPQSPSLAQEQPKTIPAPAPRREDISATERRNAPRRKGSAVSVLITDESHPEPYRGWVVDRSTTGLRLELEEAKQPGMILQLKPAEAPEATTWIPTEVRYCRQEGKAYHVGCHFLKTPPWNVLLLFG